MGNEVLAATVALLLSGNVLAQAIDDELVQAFGDKTFVSIATGSRQTLSQAPAATTVITASDIRAMGASDLDQVLESVPGLHVSHSALFNTPVYSFRGIHTGFNPEVLMLQNGLPLTTLYQGNRGLARNGTPLQNVARIEVIRGSGSALYGADAFAGVINIITKNGSEVSGTDIGAGLGSYQSKEGWLQHGSKWQDWEIALWLRKAQTGGAQNPLQADAASALDQVFGTHTSHAPGPMNNNYHALDGSIDLKQGGWRWRSQYSLRSDVGSGAGVAQALDPDGINRNERLTADLSYQTRDWAANWDISLQMNFFRMKESSWVHLYPKGSPGGRFPDGVIGAPAKSERHLGWSVAGVYTGWPQHRLRLGTGAENYALYQTREQKNFDFVFLPGEGYVVVPLPALTQASADKIFLTPQSRHLSYLMAQDEWTIAPDWTLTGGVRFDHFSDFGNTTNPRLALVWKANYNLSTKLLYGRAFRAPSFTEQYLSNNPVATGNPQVRPEKIDNLELGLGWQVQPTLQLGWNLFHYRMTDILHYVANRDPSTGATAQNTGKQHGTGMEMELNWQISHQLRLSGNLAWQRSTDEQSRQPAGLAPTRHFFLRANWQMQPEWSLDGQFNHIAGRYREPGDARPPVANYHTLDLVLRKGNDHGKWNTSLALRNAFNADAREPSLAPGSIPFDLPLARRNLYLTIEYKL